MSEATNTKGDTGLVIQLPARMLGADTTTQAQTLEKLRGLLDARKALFLRATNANQLDISTEDGKVCFAWWNQVPPFDEIPLLTQLCAALVTYAGKMKRPGFSSASFTALC